MDWEEVMRIYCRRKLNLAICDQLLVEIYWALALGVEEIELEALIYYFNGLQSLIISKSSLLSVWEKKWNHQPLDKACARRSWRGSEKNLTCKSGKIGSVEKSKKEGKEDKHVTNVGEGKTFPQWHFAMNHDLDFDDEIVSERMDGRMKGFKVQCS